MVAVPNPVDITVEGRADTRGRGQKRKILLAVGRLDSAKDHATLIAAFGRIAAHIPDWTLKIVGEGPLRAKLERQIRELGLEQRIGLAGATKNISREYRRAQLFVIPSRYESFSLTTAEALAHGLPVIGFSDCLGVNQLVVTNENGVLVTPGRDRETALAAALLPLMQSAELRERLVTVSSTPAEYRLEPVLDNWEKIMYSLISRDVPYPA
jgi:glycosyltransferase involved in cell wall biosynthesis